MFINLFHLQYPYCTSLDLQELFNGSMHTPTQIFFNLKANHEKLGFSFYAEDRNKKLEKRPLKSNMMAYVGPDISKQNLRKPSNLKLMFSIYQYIDPEADEKKKCKNYPYDGFSTYQDCDEDFVLRKFNKIYHGDILPFWVAKDPEKVTKLRCPNLIHNPYSKSLYFRFFNMSTLGFLDKNAIADLMDGTLDSTCYRPCLSTQEFFFIIL